MSNEKDNSGFLTVVVIVFSFILIMPLMSFISTIAQKKEEKPDETKK